MKNIYLFHGEDSYTSQQKAIHWLSEFEKKYGDLNSHIFEGEQLTYSGFREAVETMPFLSEKKLVIIRNFFKDAPSEELKRVADNLDKVPDHCIVVFTERQKADARTALLKNIKKIGQVIENSYFDQPKLINWIIRETTNKHGQIRSQQAANLANTVGPDLWQMSHEIDKLTLYNQDRPISDQSIEALTSQNLHSSIFKLTDFLAQKNLKASLNTLNTLIVSGEDLFQIFFMIVRHFRNLIRIKSCLNQKMTSPSIIKKLKEHPFVVNNGIKQSRNFQSEQLEKMYEYLLKLDIASKNGTIKTSTTDQTELRLWLEKSMVEICR